MTVKELIDKLQEMPPYAEATWFGHSADYDPIRDVWIDDNTVILDNLE